MQTWQNTTPTPPTANERPLLRSMRRGFASKCPHCGEGAIFSSFGKTVEECAVCGEEIHHHRADDMPAYVNIFIVGHIAVAGFVIAQRFLDWNSWQHLALWVPLTIIMAFALLQPVKGAVIGMQWANRMHGFGESNPNDTDKSALSATDYG